MKALIFSDLHIYPHKKSYDRLQDCLEALDWVFKVAEENNITNLIFCGDLFHDRQRIDIPTYQKTFQLFQNKLKARKLKVFLLVGNHDMWFSEKWDITSVAPLNAIDGIRVIDQPCAITIDGSEFGFLPYTHNPPEDLNRIIVEADRKVLFAHCAVDSAVFNFRANVLSDVSVEHDGEMIKVSAEIFSDYDRVFLGHYHGQQRLNDKVEYVGSPLQLSYGETDEQKHVIIYDSETDERTYVVNNISPVHKILLEKDVPNHKLANNFIRVVVENLNDPSVVELKNHILASKVRTYEINQAPKKIEEELKKIDNAKSLLNKGDDILKKYIETQDLTYVVDEKLNKTITLDENLLWKLGKEIFEKSYPGES